MASANAMLLQPADTPIIRPPHPKRPIPANHRLFLFLPNPHPFPNSSLPLLYVAAALMARVVGANGVRQARAACGRRRLYQRSQLPSVRARWRLEGYCRA